MLYEQSRHTSLDEMPYDPQALKETIAGILHETQQSQDATSRAWPIHPKDRYEGAPDFLTGIYFGAAGVLWAQQELKEFAGDSNANEFVTDLEKISALQAKAEVKSEEQASYFLGEAGLCTLRILAGAKDGTQAAAQVKVFINDQKSSAANELLYGSPGSLNLARLLAERLSHEEYAALASDTFKHLWSERVHDEKSGAFIWEQHLGQPLKFFGAGHGSVGNYALALRALKVAGKEHLRAELVENLEKLLRTYAQVEGDQCNWPVFINSDVPVPSLVHWCHGATGVITSLAGEISKTESPLIHELLLKAGELVWQAGPLEKGISLCHGTSGSGMAFLKLYEHTKEEKWLKRAQSFAMHAIRQYEAELAIHGQARFSLWTGDLGCAIFLRDTLRERARMPAFDFI